MTLLNAGKKIKSTKKIMFFSEKKKISDKKNKTSEKKARTPDAVKTTKRLITFFGSAIFGMQAEKHSLNT